MDRYCLTDAQWAKIEPLCLGKATDPGRTGGMNDCFSWPCCGSRARVASAVINSR